MIRSVTIPRSVPRIGSLGIVQAGGGGSASSYQFDADGLSQDPRLAYYLQSLTPAQLQIALDGGDPGPILQQTNTDLMTGEGLTCGTPGNPTCGPAPGSSLFSGLLNGMTSVPTWVWLGGAAIVATAGFFNGGRGR